MNSKTKRKWRATVSGGAPFRLVLSFSEYEAGDERTLPGQGSRCGGADVAEAARGGAGCTAGLRGQGVRRGRIADFGPVEDVRELCANVEGHTFSDPERPAEVQVFGRPPLVAVVVVIGRRSSKLASGRIHPRGGSERTWSRD